MTFTLFFRSQEAGLERLLEELREICEASVKAARGVVTADLDAFQKATWSILDAIMRWGRPSVNGDGAQGRWEEGIDLLFPASPNLAGRLRQKWQTCCEKRPKKA